MYVMCRVEAGMKDWGGMLVVAEQESIKVIKKLKRNHMMLQTYTCKLSFVRYVFFFIVHHRTQFSVVYCTTEYDMPQCKRGEPSM